VLNIKTLFNVTYLDENQLDYTVLLLNFESNFAILYLGQKY
jgi:hypothetical protein